MRADPTTAELADREIEVEAHNLVLEFYGQHRDTLTRQTLNKLEDFASWLLNRKPPPGNALVELAKRLTPNPALTAAGTLSIILDAIEKIDDQWLARALAQANAHEAGYARPLTDEEWKNGDLQAKLRLLQAARSLKLALRIAEVPQ